MRTAGTLPHAGLAGAGRPPDFAAVHDSRATIAPHPFWSRR
jgi:hypothetical protein